MGRIVVGVDGSSSARGALRWAVEEAAYRDATVEAIYVFEYTPSWQLYAYAEGVALASGTGAVEAATEEQEERAALERAEVLVAGELAHIDVPTGVVVQTIAHQDRRPAHALCERSKGADMLVVGSRGRGGFSELMLGSVSHQATHHASCPVVVVRTAVEGSEPGR